MRTSTASGMANAIDGITMAERLCQHQLDDHQIDGDGRRLQRDGQAQEEQALDPLEQPAAGTAHDGKPGHRASRTIRTVVPAATTTLLKK